MINVWHILFGTPKSEGKGLEQIKPEQPKREPEQTGLAKEMRALSQSDEAQAEIRAREQLRLRAIDGEFQKALKEIKNQAAKGKTYVQLRIDAYDDDVVRKLRAEGFKVTQTAGSFFRYDITW